MTNKYVNTQMDDLNKEETQELIRLLLASLDGKDYSTETTLASLLSAFGSEDFASEATLTAFKTAFDSRDLGTEATQELIRLILADLNSKFNTLGQKVSAVSHPVVLSTEQEGILSAIQTAVQNLDNDIDTLATEATLSAFRTDFNNEDFASETTLSAFKTAFDARNLATETTLGALLSAFNAEDFASEATLELIRLLLASLDGKDFATQATLTSLLSAFAAEDFASEATLSLFKTAFDNRDLASTVKQDAIIALLEKIDLNTDEVEVKLGDINLNTDELEIKLDTLISKDFSTETTLSALLTELGLKADLTETQPVSLASVPLPAGSATEAKQDSQIAIANLQATELTLAALLAELQLKADLTETQPVSAATLPLPTGAATEANQTSTITAINAVETDVEAGNALLTAIDAKDFATEATLNALLTALLVEDFASQATLLAFKNAFDARDLSTETTLAALLAAFNLEDFATETTLANLNSKLNTLGQKTSALSAPVVLSSEQQAILEAIKDAAEGSASDLAQEVTLQSLLTAFNAEDFATQTTLGALLTAFNAEDFATETTLSNFKTAFDNRDLATETTVSSIDGKLNTLGQKNKAGSVPVTIASDQESIKTSDIFDTSGLYSAITVGVTAVELRVGGSALADRKMVTMQVENNEVYWGYTNAVTTANGTRAFRNQTIMIPVGPNVKVWLIANGANRNVRIGELS